MDTSQLTNLEPTLGADAGVAVSGKIRASVVFAGIIGLFVAGALCAIAGVVVGNASEGEISINRDGFAGNFKR